MSKAPIEDPPKPAKQKPCNHNRTIHRRGNQEGHKTTKNQEGRWPWRRNYGWSTLRWWWYDGGSSAQLLFRVILHPQTSWTVGHKCYYPTTKERWPNTNKLPGNITYSLLSVIVRVSIVLKRTVVVDNDWRFDNLSGSHLQSHEAKFCWKEKDFVEKDPLPHRSHP